MATADENKSGRLRSPAYPSISLKKAIERAGQLHKEERRSAVHVDVAITHWGYDPKSSNGLRALAALKQFGLLTEQGKRDDRQVKLSPLAIDILMPEQDGSPEYKKAIQEAALAPPLHKAVWERYSGQLPSDPSLRRYLLLEKNFNDAFVDKFIRQFRSTISFAKLSIGDTIQEDDDTAGNGDEDSDVPATQDNPSKNLPTPAKGLRDFPLYTTGHKGGLYVPERMSKKDYELLKRQIDNSMSVILATAVDENDDE